MTGQSSAAGVKPEPAGLAPAQPATGTLVDRASRCFAAFQAGDRQAFDELVRMLAPMLWHTARAQGLDPTAAEDAVQTVWLSLLRSAGSVRDARAVTAWLVTSTRREAWRASRAATRAGRPLPGADADIGDLLGTMPAPRQDQPDERVVGADRDRVLWANVNLLPQRCRELLRVICFGDRPDYDSLAQALGMPKGSIGPTRGRCLAKLRAALSADPAWGA